MRTPVAPLVLPLLLAWATPRAAAEDIPEALAAAVQAAEDDGLALFEATRAPPPRPDAELAAARALIETTCPFTYRAVVVTGHGPRRDYFIAESAHPDRLVLAPHYRVEGGRVTASGTTCLESDPVASGDIGHRYARPDARVPSEFDVYLSLRDARPTFVTSAAGEWVLSSGEIRLLKSVPGAASGR